jgi:poly-gamma-glutamate capsule biosynthesis protein CapA/YwtB (metallophosphatase superfamily)
MRVGAFARLIAATGATALLVACGDPPPGPAGTIAAAVAGRTPAVRATDPPAAPRAVHDAARAPIELALDTTPAAAAVVADRLEPPLRTLLVAMGGDILNENAVNAAGAAAAGPGERYDFRPVFAPLAPVLDAADLAICHTELPIGAPGARPGQYGRSPYGGNQLLAPYELAAALAAGGFDRCSTASNHSNDTGPAGIASTLDALDAAGLSHTGTARTPDEAEPRVFTVGGVRVAHLAYTRSWNTDLPRDRWMLASVTTPEQVAADVATVRSAGAEIVIVSLHLGTEMQTGPTGADRTFATTLTSIADVDLVVHHGPHVVQPVERVNGTLVYWSVGNLVSGMGTAGSGKYADLRTLDGLLATVRFTESQPGRFVAESWPVVVCTSRLDRSVHPAVSELADPELAARLAPVQRDELRACIDRTVAVVGEVR